MQLLWTWKGKFFGYRDGNDLWTYQGKHVGRFSESEVYDQNGRYLGEVTNSGDRLITHRSKANWRSCSFTPYARRATMVRYVNYVGYVMYAGYEDFPVPEVWTEGRFAS